MKTTNKSALTTTNSQPTNLAKRRNFTALSLIAGLALLAFMTVTASAQITWGIATQFTGAGYAAHIAVDGQNAVEVHQLDSGSGNLEYRTGKVSTTGAITWNPVHKYDSGLSPSVALSGTNVVEIHEGTGGEIWYHTGQLLASGTIEWAASTNLEAGYAPSVAVSGTQVIEVHQASQSNPSPLWYKSGQFNPDGTITFSTATQYGNGFAPAVALAGAAMVEVHEGASGALWYQTGLVQQLGPFPIDFIISGTAQFDSGFAPTVAIAGPFIVEAHEGTGGTLWYSFGALQSNATIVWGSDTDYQDGYLPSIAIAGPDVVEVHQADEGSGPLWSLAGQF